MTRDTKVEQKESPQVNLQTYFERLPDNDRTNVQDFVSTFQQVLEKERRRVVLKAVGGQLLKPFPRKDLDFNVCLLPEDSDQISGKLGNSIYEQALANFKILKDILEKTTSRLEGFRIKETVEPTIEEEYLNPAVLKTGGSITIEPREGTLIEIFREAENPYSVKEGPYVVLIDV